jgi:hypothetical protein
MIYIFLSAYEYLLRLLEMKILNVHRYKCTSLKNINRGISRSHDGDLPFRASNNSLEPLTSTCFESFTEMTKTEIETTVIIICISFYAASDIYLCRS